METGGWILMIISVGGVSLFFGWNLFMVLTRKPDEMPSLHDDPPDIKD